MSVRYVWEKWNKASEKYYSYSTYDSGWVNDFVNGTGYRSLSVVDDTDPYTQVKLSGKTSDEDVAEYLYISDHNGTDPMVTSAGQVFKYHKVGSVKIWEYRGQIVESTRYKKGSTSYGNVSSGSSGAYPANSYSGNYWYVKKGNDTIDPASVTYKLHLRHRVKLRSSSCWKAAFYRMNIPEKKCWRIFLMKQFDRWRIS